MAIREEAVMDGEIVHAISQDALVDVGENAPANGDIARSRFSVRVDNEITIVAPAEGTMIDQGVTDCPRDGKNRPLLGLRIC